MHEMSLAEGVLQLIEDAARKDHLARYWLVYGVREDGADDGRF